MALDGAFQDGLFKMAAQYFLRPTPVSVWRLIPIALGGFSSPRVPVFPQDSRLILLHILQIQARILISPAVL